MDRRTFLSTLGAGAALSLPARRPPGVSWPSPPQARSPLPAMAGVSGEGLTLTAAPATVDIGRARTDAWALNGTVPAPVIRLRRGARADILLENGLSDETILHWHGLSVPEAADGHPRLAIAPGDRYRYRFEVTDRPGTYWYHPHTHRRTAEQTYLGMAGLLVVEGEEETALELPTGEREILLILQDKRLGGSSSLAYAPTMGPDLMLGYLGDTAFGNGVADPTVSVARARHRLRILNASNARIFELGLSDGVGLTLIGTDGGLLETPIELDRMTLATGERADVLVDLSDRRPGDRIVLRSHAFEVPEMMGMMTGMGRGRGRGGGMMGGLAQGAPMDLLELVVADTPADGGPPLPERLSTLPGPHPDAGAATRVFRFTSMMMSHTINGRPFELERVDERVPLGRTEVWSLVNDSELPHPVHIHAGQFRVLRRAGGRNRVMPWERGLKDTVLIFPRERVDVAVRFAEHPGLFLLHCHNLEHEDAGMMMNFEVVE